MFLDLGLWTVAGVSENRAEHLSAILKTVDLSSCFDSYFSLNYLKMHDDLELSGNYKGFIV